MIKGEPSVRLILEWEMSDSNGYIKDSSNRQETSRNLESLANEGASSSDTHHIINQEIKQLYERIRARKSDWNKLAFISKLPVELLSYIFSLVRRKYRQRSRFDLGWVVVTHVCQRWRDIALDCPTLWVYISFNRPQWVPEMTRRSKSARLDIELNV